MIVRAELVRRVVDDVARTCVEDNGADGYVDVLVASQAIISTLANVVAQSAIGMVESLGGRAPLAEGAGAFIADVAENARHCVAMNRCPDKEKAH